MAGTIAEKWVERAIADIVGRLEFGAAIVCSLQRASHGMSRVLIWINERAQMRPTVVEENGASP
jgi:hypothetical protein